MAYIPKKGRPHYVLRESCLKKEGTGFRTLFDLGPDPRAFIQYVGGNAFYFDEEMEATLLEKAQTYDADELEDIFWPWIRADIKAAVSTFRNRSGRSSKKLSADEKEQIATHVNAFDKRRAHFLKFAVMDQGAVENMPPALFKSLLHKSRDEIEQGFLMQESALKARELKSYVYTIFDLQRFFKSFMAKKMPHTLDQEKVDTFFIEEICRLNSRLFSSEKKLDDYMVRYLVMFFDHSYADSTLLDDFAQAFMSSRRSYRPPPPKNTVSESRAIKIFNLNPEQIKTLGKQQLTRSYRTLARSFHPDTGGSHEKFVELKGAYETLLKKISPEN